MCIRDRYNREGYRDDNFDENDKGMWLLYTEIGVVEGDELHSEGMVLKINRNSKKANGYYFIKTFYDDKNKERKEQKYPVKMENNKIILTQDIQDEKLKRKIERFKFFSQYGKFKGLSKYGNGNISYNPNVPSYSAEYQLNNDDDNLKKIREKHNLKTENEPKLNLNGTGQLSGSVTGYKELEYIFGENPYDSYLNDSVDYHPQEEGLE